MRFNSSFDHVLNTMKISVYNDILSRYTKPITNNSNPFKSGNELKVLADTIQIDTLEREYNISKIESKLAEYMSRHADDRRVLVTITSLDNSTHLDFDFTDIRLYNDKKFFIYNVAKKHQLSILSYIQNRLIERGGYETSLYNKTLDKLPCLLTVKW